jgi:Spy/CpxP family protein refolding chaperone
MEFSTDRRKAVALVTLVFLLGIAFGVVGVLAGRRLLGAGNQGRVAGPQQSSQLMRELNLTPDQESQFRQTLADTRDRYEAIRRAMDPQMREVRQQSRERIRQILAPEQQQGFDEFLRNSRGRRNDRNGPNGQNGQTAQNSQNGRNARNDLSQVARLTQQLALTPDQQTRLSDILRETRSSFDALRQQMNPQFEEARLQNRERLRQIITPEQLPVLESFFQRRDEDRRRR